MKCPTCKKEKSVDDFRSNKDAGFIPCKDCTAEREKRRQETARAKRKEYFTDGKFAWTCSACRQPMGKIFITSPNTLLVKAQESKQDINIAFEKVGGICSKEYCHTYSILLSGKRAKEVGYSEERLKETMGVIDYAIDQSNFHLNEDFVESDISEKYYLDNYQQETMTKLLSEKRREVYKLLIRGTPPDDIAKRLNLPADIVKEHVEKIDAFIQKSRSKVT